jgi:hypothetical protein
VTYWEIIADNLSKAGWSLELRLGPWILADERSGIYSKRGRVFPTVCIERIAYERLSDRKSEDPVLAIAKMPEERHRDIVQRERTAQVKNTD